MDSYKKIIVIQWLFILLLLIFSGYQLNKNTEISDDISSLTSQIDELQGPTEAADVSEQISDLENKVSDHTEQFEKHQNEISNLSSRLDESESNIEKNSDKLDDLCLVKNICI
ncbi:conserved hypothetical protein [Acinetobacter proteolyticus]|uniref:Uncharacterized protein n=1 Tax=Acinetobacter proteolyticus TaxID=1776741 RepID=A0A653KBG4_9GAMM|nr:hypothetical protein [Acinetobacter proteolyticus]VXA58273.1 conserved hypothetical protein [Acinetobacter proteolyticus]